MRTEHSGLVKLLLATLAFAARAFGGDAIRVASNLDWNLSSSVHKAGSITRPAYFFESWKWSLIMSLQDLTVTGAVKLPFSPANEDITSAMIFDQLARRLVDNQVFLPLRSKHRIVVLLQFLFGDKLVLE